jgi:hypothetical protein
MSGSDEITEWLARRGRKTLDLETARALAADSPELWYVASHGALGFLVGKMTMQKYSARHILVGRDGEAMHFPTAEAAIAFLRTELKVPNPHVFNY